MSASLVGSEMCIRDRHWAAHRPCPPRAVATLCPPHRTHLSCTVCHYSKAVSYTHLTLPTICSV
eukprot:12942200-Alexandrium_andersonii.AAC.1